METYSSPYASRFVAAYTVKTAREIFAWTEHHPHIEGAGWRTDLYQNSGDPNEGSFILAVPVPEAGGLGQEFVGFFAPSAADADRIRASVF